jgi:tetratricopeptide (TPR) repeat protein
MLGAELPSERRVALELRVRGLRAELERACAHEPAASSDRSGAMDSGNAEVGTDDGELELRGSAADALEIELRSASAVALREALIERLALRAEPCPVTLSARRFEVRAQGIDAAELLRDAAGCSGWRIAGAFENDARVVLRWIPWGAAPSPAEREEMLERIAASTLALETAPIADFTRAEARFLRARALEALGDEQRALAEYALLAEQSGSGSWALEALRRSAGIHARRGDAERALLCWEAVLAREPDEPLRHLALLQSADLQLARGLRDAARERYEELLRLRPDGAAARAARLGRLACLFERELAQATPQRLRLLASELASEADARRDPQLRPRYLALSSALLRRIGATPLSLRETLAACVEESDAARREQAALAAAALALELNAPLAALWSLDLAPTATCAPAAELRAAARALLGFDDIDTAGASSSARAKEAAEGLANANDKELMPRLDALERTLARLRERRVTQELSR